MVASAKVMVPIQANTFSEGPVNRAAVTMANEESKHRMKVPLYDIEPQIENCWIAPNATIGKYFLLFLIPYTSIIVGEVRIRRWASVWYNSVVRGDINQVTIGRFSSVGDNTVIHTAASLPTGMSANCEIGHNV